MTCSWGHAAAWWFLLPVLSPPFLPPPAPPGSTEGTNWGFSSSSVRLEVPGLYLWVLESAPCSGFKLHRKSQQRKDENILLPNPR